MKKQKFRVLSPDGFDTQRDTIFSTYEQAEQETKDFASRFIRQGYYSNQYRERIPLNEIANNCKIITA
jgi:hypothetical protein